jgi:hypothetical protein
VPSTEVLEEWLHDPVQTGEVNNVKSVVVQHLEVNVDASTNRICKRKLGLSDLLTEIIEKTLNLLPVVFVPQWFRHVLKANVPKAILTVILPVRVAAKPLISEVWCHLVFR